MSDQIVIGTHNDSGLAIVRDGVDLNREANMQIARECMRILLDAFPGYPWTVTADVEQGVVTLALPSIMGKFSFIIHADAIATANDMAREIRRAGGEILERYKLRRGSMIGAEFSDVRKAIKSPRLIKAIPA